MAAMNLDSNTGGMNDAGSRAFVVEGLSPSIVIAWFTTVLNPMIAALEAQREHLIRGSLTWRHSTHSFELLVRPSDFIELEYLPNLDQFLETYPDVADVARAHADAIEALRRACEALQRAVEEHGGLRETVARGLAAVDPLEESTVGRSAIEDLIAIFAQHLINRVAELPPHYVGHEIWNAHLSAFRQAYRSVELEEPRSAVRRAIERVSNTVETFRSTLKGIRSALGLRYGVPFVPPSKVV